MLFSNLVTDLSANSARVSACNDSICFGQNWNVLGFQERWVQGKTRKWKSSTAPTDWAGNYSSASHHRERWQLAQHTNPGTTADHSWRGAAQLENAKAPTCSMKTSSFKTQVALPKTVIALPPSACQKGPWSPPHTCLPSESTVIRKNVPDVRPRLTLYSSLLIQRKRQPSKQMLRISQAVMEPPRSNGTLQYSLCSPAYCFTRDKNKITSLWHRV